MPQPPESQHSPQDEALFMATAAYIVGVIFAAKGGMALASHQETFGLIDVGVALAASSVGAFLLSKAEVNKP